MGPNVFHTTAIVPPPDHPNFHTNFMVHLPDLRTTSASISSWVNFQSMNHVEKNVEKNVASVSYLIL